MSLTIYNPVAIPPADVTADVTIVKPVRTTVNTAARLATDGASRSGVWVAIFAITMSFAAFTSALFVREGSAAVDWTHLALPPILYANTTVLLLGSVTLWIASRTVNAHALLDSQALKIVMGWLIATLALGVLFIAGQYEAWRQLAAQGLFLATSPNSSFFYVFTGMHILHLFGGIAALVYLIGQLFASHTTFRRGAFHNTAIYWHFMGVLWLYLLFVLRTKL
jgi:cytochrome c oxidase subunit 3